MRTSPLLDMVTSGAPPLLAHPDMMSSRLQIVDSDLIKNGDERQIAAKFFSKTRCAFIDVGMHAI